MFNFDIFSTYKNSNAIIKQVFAFAVIGIVVSLFTPKALLDRFETKDSARQDEAKGMFTQLTPLELVIGRGLGGTYYVEKGGIVQSINNEGRAVSANMHIGALYPILKGGVLLFLLIFYSIGYRL